MKTVNQVFGDIEREFEMKREQIVKGKSRRELVVRYITFAVFYEAFAYSFTEIGRIFGCDQSTVRHGYRQAMTYEKTEEIIHDVGEGWRLRANPPRIP